MKKSLSALFALLAIGSFAAVANAKTPSNSKAICDSIQNKLDVQCAHVMCDDGIAQGIYKSLDDCTNSEDYAEAAQGGCDQLPSLEEAVKQYNKKHPSANLQCQE